MADTRTLIVELPQAVLDGLESLSERTGRDVAEIAGVALAAYLDLQERQKAAIAKANAEGDGPWVANEDVMRWLESWETPNELPPPV
jgi:RHH-type rel operon transcriptional repressor/antitoxin RelB